MTDSKYPNHNNSLDHDDLTAASDCNSKADAFEAAVSAIHDSLAGLNTFGMDSFTRELLVTLKDATISILCHFRAGKTETHGVRSYYALASEAMEHTNRLLVYCIIYLIEPEKVSPQLAAKAIAAYVEASEAYDVVLTHYLPSSFLAEAELALQRKRYREGTNVTALDDWVVFKREFESSPGGLPTGIDSLDTALGGGLRGITVVGGDEASGKTSLCLSMMIAALRKDEGLGCEYYTVDQPKRQTLARLLSLVSGVDASTLRLNRESRSHQLNRKIADAEEELIQDLLPRIRFIERSNIERGSLSLDTLRKIDLEFGEESESERVLVVVDLFQSLAEMGSSGTANEVDESFLALIQRFVAWTKTDESRQGATVILASEVRKDCKELTNDDLRGSARLGSTPDNIILLWPTPGKETGDVVGRTLKVGKSRDGNAGMQIALEFAHKIGQFREIEGRSCIHGSQAASRQRLPRKFSGKQL